MDSKKYAVKTIAYTLIVLALIAVVIFITDPFVRYHKPLFGLAAAETDERSQVLGLARNLDYDTALIGSSMSENFRHSWFEDGIIAGKCVKLSLQGAHFSDYEPVFNEVLKKDSVKKIYFSLDNYLVEHEPSEHEKTIPDYLEGNPSANDVYYLLNKSVLIDYLPRFIINNVREGYSDDNAYSWDKYYTFDKYAARASYVGVRLLARRDEKPFDAFFPQCDELLNNLIPYIENNPDVEFNFYAAPYSILFWDDCLLEGNLTAEICGLEKLYNRLLDYDNVRIFYFQNDYELITDLDHYRDYSHFDKATSYYLYECMRDGNYEVTKATYYDTLLDMYNFALEYDYESCFH